MNKEIREIGLEKELFLLRGEEIMEPSKFGFPHDEFQFLVEIRSLPSDRLYPVYTTIQQEELQYKLRANKFGMVLDDTPNRTVTKDWVDDLWNKYNLHRFNDCDYTKNIYKNNKSSHHLGVLDTGHPDTKKLTAGMHVHFSSRGINTGEVIDLPIEDIASQMDEIYSVLIEDSGRIKGEIEQKQHGWEYRSLPANADVYDVLKTSFKILRES
jgi:hypothetical protein